LRREKTVTNMLAMLPMRPKQQPGSLQFTYSCDQLSDVSAAAAVTYFVGFVLATTD
jgi:hypothetical protein